MPRKKKIRRFDPQIGVSQPMLDEEARWVAKEMENYLLLSTTDLREKMDARQQNWNRAHAALEKCLSAIKEKPHRIALKALIIRDCYFILELYLTYLRQASPDDLPATPPTATASADGASVLPFKESLFDLLEQ